MQQPSSSEQFNGMRLSSFRQYCTHHENPFQRKQLENHPFWTTSDGKIVWLKVVQPEGQVTRYELQTCTLEEYCQTPLIQRGVARLDQYYSPQKPDTPLLKRRARVIEQIRSYSISSHIPSKRPEQSLPERSSTVLAPLTAKTIRPVAPDSQKNEIPSSGRSRNQPPKLRLIERVSEIAYGDLDERVTLFLRRAAREIPESPEQLGNRWFGMNKGGHIVMTKSSWLSFFFPNRDIKRFIRHYAPALVRRNQRINLIRQWYNLPPIHIQIPEKERHCHAEILQKQLLAISQVTDNDFRALLQRDMQSTAQMLFHFEDCRPPLPSPIKQKFKQTCQLIADWMQCASPSEHNSIIDQFMYEVTRMCSDPTVRSHRPGLSAEILKAAPKELQTKIQGQQNQARLSRQN